MFYFGTSGFSTACLKAADEKTRRVCRPGMRMASQETLEFSISPASVLIPLFVGRRSAFRYHPFAPTVPDQPQREVEASRSFERMDIMNPELNVEWVGSREQMLLAPDALDAELAAGNGADTAPAAQPAAEAPQSEAAPAPEAIAADPLAGLI